MKKLIAAVGISLFAVCAFAETSVPVPTRSEEAKAEKPMTPQQMKMKACNAEAKENGLKKQKRKDFMKSCLAGDKK